MSTRMMPLVVSHYTTNSPYEYEVKKLVESTKRFGLDLFLVGIPSLGSWRENSNYCAKSVRTALRHFPDRDVLRVDADAVFNEAPTLFLQDDFEADVAACVYDFSYKENELLGGTLYFKNCNKVRNLVELWVTFACETRRRERNGDLLQGIVDPKHWTGKFVKLPPSYCKIFDRMEEVENPIIEHFQASRKFRRLMNQPKIRKELLDGVDN